MGKKKHKKKKKEAEQRSVLQTPSREIFSSEAINQAAERIRQIGNTLGMIGRQAVSLPLGGGTVRTARITSKGILFAEKKHYNSEYVQSFCGREVLIHEIDGYMRVYLYEERERVLGGMICVHNMSEEGKEIPRQRKDHPGEKEASGRLDWEDALKRVIEARTNADQYSHSNH